jgi:release factor glutamine methyltransferase
MQPAPVPTTERWTILSLVERTTAHLVENRIDEARLNTELLLAHVLNFSRLQLYTNFDRPISVEELSLFRKLILRRLKREPLQYILGETDFMGFPLYVNQYVLIPRPETELLVEKTRDLIIPLRLERVDILDIGTGSGNIPIALEKFIENAAITSMDVSAEAQQVALRNFERNKISRVTLIQASVFDDFLPGISFDVIVSNPPYISENEFAELQPEIKDYEPRIATTDGGDGLTFVRRICAVAQEKLRPTGFVLIEIAYNQSDEALRIAREVGLRFPAVHKDYDGHPRILSAQK